MLSGLEHGLGESGIVSNSLGYGLGPIVVYGVWGPLVAPRGEAEVKEGYSPKGLPTRRRSCGPIEVTRAVTRQFFLPKKSNIKPVNAHVVDIEDLYNLVLANSCKHVKRHKS